MTYPVRGDSVSSLWSASRANTYSDGRDDRVRLPRAIVNPPERVGRRRRAWMKAPKFCLALLDSVTTSAAADWCWRNLAGTDTRSTDPSEDFLSTCSGIDGKAKTITMKYSRRQWLPRPSRQLFPCFFVYLLAILRENGNKIIISRADRCGSGLSQNSGQWPNM